MTPFRDLVDTLSKFVEQQVPQVVVCQEGYPDQKFLQLDNNLPGVFWVIPSSRPMATRGRLYAFGPDVVDASNNASSTFVLNKREYLFQGHIIAKTKADVVGIGDEMWSQLSEQWYLPLQDNMQNSQITMHGDMMVTKGEETNYHRRIITFYATLRQLSTAVGYGFKGAQVTGTIGITPPVEGRSSTVDITITDGDPDPVITPQK